MSETKMSTPPCRHTVAKLIEYQIHQVFDRTRMREAWERVFASGEPAELAEGMCMALSGGRFSREPRPVVTMAPQITINVSGDVDPEALANALKGALAEAMPAG